MNSFLNETGEYELEHYVTSGAYLSERLEATMQTPVNPGRPHEEAVIERFRKRPDYALHLLNHCLEEGDQAFFSEYIAAACQGVWWHPAGGAAGKHQRKRPFTGFLSAEEIPAG